MQITLTIDYPGTKSEPDVAQALEMLAGEINAIGIERIETNRKSHFVGGVYVTLNK